MDELDQTRADDVAAEQEIQPKGFAAAELISCEVCARANPPTRTACLYCGAALRKTAASQEVPGEVLDSETAASTGRGAYVVLVPDANGLIEQSAVEQLASWLQVKPTELQNALRAAGPLPLRGAKTEAEANSFADQTKPLGLRTLIIPETEMDFARSLRRVRALEMSDESLSGLSITSGDKFTVGWSDIILVVVGRLITTEAEATEKKKRGHQELTAQREVSADEPVIDIWMRSGPAWRIFVNSFDFSCLGASKNLTAFENTKALLEIFRARAPDAQVAESYGRVRAILANVWPLEKQTKNSQLRHAGIGRREFATVTTTNNHTQFNNYSQMMYCVRLRQTF